MKCPKCSNEIKDGYLYCDKCGEEIRIVPDFEATFDDKINISFTDDIDSDVVLEELSKVETKEIDAEINKEATREIDIKSSGLGANVTNKTSDDRIIIKALVFAGAICVVLVIMGILVNGRLNMYYSVDSQYEKAFEQYESGRYDESIKTLKHALSIDPSDLRLRSLLADNYYNLKKYDESNALLYEMLELYPDDPAILEKIIRNNEEKGDYQAISILLENEKDSSLGDEYSKYISENVEFSVPAGDYYEAINLELYAGENAVIYYTLDGSDPNDKSMMYNEPLILEDGEYTIKAIAINGFGIKSDVSEATYYIDFDVPEKPIVLTKAGTYNVPVLVEVKISDYDLCYYTIDGEDPTSDDMLYQGPFAMYIDKHTYKFATISSKGTSSEVVEIELNAELITLIDMDMAKTNIINYKTATGTISPDYTYKCEQAYEYNNSTYYIVNEYTKSGEDEVQTGNHYAVDVLTGLTFRAILNKSTGAYSLEALL
ncbi:MAG: chitobiase/beta-hexosaminidase C-terminal domain-containing protein [Lachnospiraceae bacterium]|nr:chitobiase/beta-hexosaminidase C-terminal domain-containing protein [Lachnospiraceae bacterium]